MKADASALARKDIPYVKKERGRMHIRARLEVWSGIRRRIGLQAILLEDGTPLATHISHVRSLLGTGVPNSATVMSTLRFGTDLPIIVNPSPLTSSLLLMKTASMI